MEAEEYKNLSKKEFGKAASRYDTDEAGVYKICRHDYPAILAEIRKEDFDTLLDAGCGTAPMLSLLTKEYPDKKFTGIDITPEMIEVAKSKQLPNTEFVVGDCENMPFGENTFDVIINSQSLHHYPSPLRFLKNVEKILRPGGRLILRDMSTITPLAWVVNHIEIPLLNKIGYGDVAIVTKPEMRELCELVGLEIETLKLQCPFRIHLVARKNR